MATSSLSSRQLSTLSALLPIKNKECVLPENASDQLILATGSFAMVGWRKEEIKKGKHRFCQTQGPNLTKEVLNIICSFFSTKKEEWWDEDYKVWKNYPEADVTLNICDSYYFVVSCHTDGLATDDCDLWGYAPNWKNQSITIQHQGHPQWLKILEREACKYK